MAWLSLILFVISIGAAFTSGYHRSPYHPDHKKQIMAFLVAGGTLVLGVVVAYLGHATAADHQYAECLHMRDNFLAYSRPHCYKPVLILFWIKPVFHGVLIGLADWFGLWIMGKGH